MIRVNCALLLLTQKVLQSIILLFITSFFVVSALVKSILSSCPKRLSKSTKHEPNHSEMDESFARFGQHFQVTGQATVRIEPGKGTFNHPAFV